MSRALAITVVTETYPPEINGVAHTMRQLVMGLRGRGHRVQVVRPRQRTDPRRPPATETLVPGLPIPGYTGLRFGLPVFRRLRRQWQRARPDLVYIATEGPLGHAALRAAEAHGIATLTGFHTRFDFMLHLPLGEQKLDSFRALRARFSANPALAFACGDEAEDYASALGAGLHPFIVSYGFEDFERLRVRHAIPEELISRTPAALAARLCHALALPAPGT